MQQLTRMLLACVLLVGCSVGGAQPAALTSEPLPTPTPTPPLAASARSTATPESTVSPSLPSPTLPAHSLPASPSPRAVESSATPAPEQQEFSINLYREGAFISQYTKYWCLPAAMQTMINMLAEGEPDTSRETQERLYWQARELSTETLRPNGKGAQPEGWANSLNAEGYGPYSVHVEPTLKEAVALAARQLRLTGKPVGLLTWRGAHSWSMSGFEATADPALTDDFEVTGVWIQDVWWPRVSTIWGESPEPNSLIAMDDLGEDLRRYRRPGRTFPDKDGQYVLIIPLEETAG